jgi:hypothetical protein
MKRTIVILGAAAAILATSSARAQEGGAEPPAREFGSAGVLDFGAITAFGHVSGVLGINNFPGNISGLTADHTTTSPPQGDSRSENVLLLSPEVDYFVINNLSIGGALLLGVVIPGKGDSATIVGIGPTVGYNIWLSPGTLSLWPRATFTYESIGTSATVTTQNQTTETTFTYSKASVGLFVPLLIHPVKHFHFGIGPYVATDLSASVSSGGKSTDADKATVIGLRAEIGGWL